MPARDRARARSRDRPGSPPLNRGCRVALVAWAALVASTAHAAAQLDVAAETAPDLRVRARNTGDEPARDVTAEVLYQHRSETAPPISLAPGEGHEWRFAIAPPPGPGIFTATIRLRYRDGGGGARSVPLVAPVATPGAASPSVRATLDAEPVTRIGRAVLKLTGDGPPVVGRAVFTLPGGLTTEPESVPAQVAAGPGTIVPLVIRNDANLPPGRYPLYATFEYSLAGEHEAVIARATVAVTERTAQPRTRPLLVGLGALGAALVVLAFAWRAVARRPAA